MESDLNMIKVYQYTIDGRLGTLEKDFNIEDFEITKVEHYSSIIDKYYTDGHIERSYKVLHCTTVVHYRRTKKGVI